MWQLFSKARTECEVNSDTDQEGRTLVGPKHLCWGVVQLGADQGWRMLGVTDEAQRGRNTCSVSFSRWDQRLLPRLPSRGRS